VNGFTTHGVPGLARPSTKSTFTNEDLPTAITRDAARGRVLVCRLSKDVHAFVDDVGGGAAALIASHKSLANFTKDKDRTQVLSRVYVEGRGSRLLAAVGVGETLLPIEAADMFEAAADVFLKISFAGSDGGAMHATFTGVVPGGLGTLVGPGATPSAGPTLTPAAGGAIESGVHSYSYTWVTASGETRPSPATAITVAGALAKPVLGPYVEFFNGVGGAVPPNSPQSWRTGDLIEWGCNYAYSNQDAPTAGTRISPIAGPYVCQQSPYYYNTPGDSAKSFLVAFPLSPDPNCTAIWPGIG
jgi:hypothetical protein